MQRRKALAVAATTAVTLGAAGMATAANLGLLTHAGEDSVGKLNATNVAELVDATSTTRPSVITVVVEDGSVPAEPGADDPPATAATSGGPGSVPAPAAAPAETITEPEAPEVVGDDPAPAAPGSPSGAAGAPNGVGAQSQPSAGQPAPSSSPTPVAPAPSRSATRPPTTPTTSSPVTTKVERRDDDDGSDDGAEEQEEPEDHDDD
jgi:hypothetical protein